ncbi:MAG: hypothetical protein ACYCS7_01795, partial [Acidimicrobiales bacterium]
MRRPSLATLATFLTVGGAALFVFIQLHPSLLLRNTTTAGGDMGAHVAVPAYMRDHLLKHFSLTGWSPEWYDGYPALTFYFPIPSLMVVVANLVLPYNIAFKLITVSGLVALPVAAWAFGKLAGLRRPAPACLAVGALGFLFDQSFTIDGGNIASTLAGEYPFAISLAIGLVFLGLVARGLETRSSRALAAVLLALTALCHLVPTLFVAAGAMVLLAMKPGRRRLGWSVAVGGTGLLLTGFWSLPFALRQAYTTNMGYEKVTTFASSLFPASLHFWLGLAVFGALVSVARRRRIGIWLILMAGLSALAFVLAPAGKLYNARFLPFWILCVYLLAGLALYEIAVLAAQVWRWTASLAPRPRPVPVLAGTAPSGPGTAPEPLGPGHDTAPEPLGPGHDTAPSPSQGGGAPEGATSSSPGEDVAIRKNPLDGPGAWLTPLLALFVGLSAVGVGLQITPTWFPFKAGAASFVSSWATWNYSGYEAKPAYPEYHALITTMAQVGRSHGCGRAMWEYEPQLDQLGTPMALMLLPYWTNGCIDSEEGLFFESSATTPAHFINQSELSVTPSRAVRGLDYGPLDVAEGVRHLQLLGVKYYMAFSPQAQAQAATNQNLTLVASTGPWPVTYGTQVIQRTWDVYEIRSSRQVQALNYAPAVMTGVAQGGASWLNASMDWYLHPARWDVLMAASGPSSWSRVPANDPNPPRRAMPPTQVSAITHSDNSIGFSVDRIGTPVLVKVSYFPNWQASGARGPYRVAPNIMVVVPTSHRVLLHYGSTPVDYLGWAATGAGFVLVVLLALGD